MLSPIVAPRSTQARVAHPHVVAHLHVALVDALLADGALHLDHAVVEVDEHAAVGEDALAPDRDVLVGGDRALLPEDALGADAHLPLVHSDIGPVADPRPAAEHQAGVPPDLQGDAGPHERHPVGHQPPAPAQLQPRQAQREAQVGEVEHPVRAQEAQEHERAATPGRRAGAHAGGNPFDPGSVQQRHDGPKLKGAPAAPGMIRRLMAPEDRLAERLISGDKRALARGISLVENDDPAGWERARGLPAHRPGLDPRLHGAAGRGQVRSWPP